MSLGSQSHHQIDYLEFGATDISESKSFFSSLLGWEFTEYAPTYFGIKVNGQEIGGLSQVESVTSGGPLIIFFSENLENSFEQATKLNAKITKEIFEFPGGRRFEFCDPSGNQFAIWGK